MSFLVGRCDRAACAAPLNALSLPPVGLEEQRWYSFGHIVTGQAENNSHRSGTEIKELGTCVVDVATPAFGH